MRIIISNKSPVPIYEQIKNEIIKQILNDEIVTDEKLPSIRVLAKDLKVSVITTTRAYKELEEEGYIISVASKGFFVLSKNENLSREIVIANMEKYLFEALKLKHKLNLSKDEFSAIINILEEELNNE